MSELERCGLQQARYNITLAKLKNSQSRVASSRESKDSKLDPGSPEGSITLLLDAAALLDQALDWIKAVLDSPPTEHTNRLTQSPSTQPETSPTRAERDCFVAGFVLGALLALCVSGLAILLA